MEPTAREYAETAEEKAEELGSRFDEARDIAERYAGQAKDKALRYAHQASDVTRDQIQRSPFWSMLIVLGVGLSLGMLLASTVKKD